LLGVLDDNYREFFIVEESVSHSEKSMDKETNAHNGAVDDYWSYRFILRDEQIPSFIEHGMCIIKI
jgi:hypothetical protein